MKHLLTCTLCAITFVGAVLSSQAVDITLEWDAPTNTVDGDPINDLCHYVVCYGTESGIYTENVNIPCTDTDSVITDLEYNKTYYFSVKACTSNALESDLSEEIMWQAPTMPDVDGDQISDAWEIERFGGIGAIDSTTDSDADGMSDLKEFIAGTNPLADDQYPQLSINNMPATGATLSFTTEQPQGSGYENRNRYYTLKRCTDLASGVWEDVPGHQRILAMGQTITYSLDTEQQTAYYTTAISLE